MDFPAELPDIVDAEYADQGAGQCDFLRRKPTEGGVRHVGISGRRQNLTQLRADDDEHPERVGDIGDGHLRPGGKSQVAARLFLGARAGQDVEVVAAKPHNRPFAQDTVIVGQPLRQPDAALLLRQAVCGQPVEKSFGPPARSRRT